MAAILSAVYIFWMLTLGIFLIEINSPKRPDWKKLVLSLIQNPLLLSVFAGLFIVVFQIQLPVVVEKTIVLFSDSVTAVVLFSLGIFLGFHNTGNFREWIKVFVLSVVTMLVLPAAFFLIAKNTGLETSQLKATILDAAMPLGVTPYALSVQYKLETTLFARVVVLATLLSVLIIPLWIVILG